MMSNSGWKQYRLDELGFVGRGKSRHRPRNDPRLFGGDHPFIQTADIMSADPYITNYKQTYSDFGLAQSKLWNPDTLCITIAGANTAKTAILKISACFPDSVVGFIPDRARANLYFVKYVLDLMKADFLSVTRGATQDNLSLDKLLSFPIMTPPVSTQDEIGELLQAFDDLIENNTRRIAILEEMARRIFEEWFVHFRAPGCEGLPLGESAVGPVPRGSMIGTLSDLATLTGSSISPARFDEEIFSHFSYPAFDANGLPCREAGFTIRSNKLVFPTQSVLLGKLNPRIKRIWLVLEECPTRMIASTEFMPLRPKIPTGLAHLYSLVSSNLFGDQLRGLTGGTSTSHQRATPRDVMALPIVIPPKSIIQQYNEAAMPNLGLASVLRSTNANLRAQRDLLLPKLISGEIDVTAASTALKEAAE